MSKIDITHKKAIHLFQLGQFEQAILLLKEVLRINPSKEEAIFYLANSYKEIGNYNEAIFLYNRLIDINSTKANYLINLALLYKNIGKIDKSIDLFKKVFQKEPNSKEGYFNLGNLLRDIGQFNASVNSYEKCIGLDPFYFDAINNLANVQFMLGNIDDSIKLYRKTLSIRPKDPYAFNSYLSTLSYSVNFTNETIFVESKKFNNLLESEINFYDKSSLSPSKGKKLRIGFVSGDFRSHPVGYFLRPLLENLDKKKFEIFSFSNNPFDDSYTVTLKNFFDSWLDIKSLDDKTAAELVYKSKIDFLIDLSGHTGHNRLPIFAFRPARFQLTWLGYWSTTGVNEIDYIIGDPHLIPPNNDKFYTEKVLRLPNTRWCYSMENDLDNQSKSLYSKKRKFTFGYMGNFAKVNQEVIDVWVSLLKEFPETNIFLKSRIFLDTEIKQTFKNFFVNQKIDPCRVTLEAHGNKEEYLKSFLKLDIFIDTYPFSSGTTIMDSLLMGTPVISKYGDKAISRQGYSILKNVALDNWAVKNKQSLINEFRSIAYSYSDDTRLKLKERIFESDLFNGKKFTKDFEVLLENLTK